MSSSGSSREKRRQNDSSRENHEEEEEKNGESSKRLHVSDMAEAHFIASDTMKKVIDATCDIVEDVNLDFTPYVEGVKSFPISFQSMDGSHVALVRAGFKKEAFSHYRCDQAVTCGCTLKTLHRLLKHCSTSDILKLKRESVESCVLKVTTQNVSNTLQKEYDVTLMDIDCDSLSIPETQYDVTITMTASVFKKTVSECVETGSDTFITCTKEGIRFFAKGDTLAANIFHAARVSDTEDDPNTVLMKLENEVPRMMYASKYLKMFCKLDSDFVVIHIGRDTPLYIKHTNPMFELGFYLAPKIDQSDE